MRALRALRNPVRVQLRTRERIVRLDATRIRIQEDVLRHRIDLEKHGERVQTL